MFQEKFIEILKKDIPAHISIVDELAELLSISKDSAYRRLRNETPFTLDEAVFVCQKFKIDVSPLLGMSTDAIRFKYNKLYDEKNSFIQYLKGLTGVLKSISIPDASITYAAEDVPMYYHFESDYLASFKIFYWSKAVLNSDLYIGKKFDPEMVHPDIRAAGKEFAKAYNGCRSTEIWTEESINSTLRQIEYFAESGQFETKDSAMHVITDFEEMIGRLQRKAELSNKEMDENGPKNFTMYNSEVLIGNNCILLEYPGSTNVLLSHNTFNSLHTKDEAFCDETKKWIDNLIKKSTLISDVSEKHRYIFFKHVAQAIENTRKKVDAIQI